MAQKQEKSRLADLLVEMRLLEEEAGAAAVAEQRSTGRRLPKILAERRLIDEERLAKSVAGKLGLEAVALAGMRIHERVVGLLPAATAIKHGIIPIAIKRTNSAEVLYLVMCDPLDTEAIGEVQRITGRQVRVLIATATDVDLAIEEHYKNRPSSPPVPAPSKLPFTAPRGNGLPASNKGPGAPPAKGSAASRRAESGVRLPPPRSNSQNGAPSGAVKARGSAASALAPAPLAPLVPPESVPPVVRGSPVFPGASAADVYRPTLIDAPRPPELQQLFMAELQREAPLVRPKPEGQRGPRPSVSDLVFPSELDPPDSVSTRVDERLLAPDDEATAQPGVGEGPPPVDVDWDLAVKDWESQDISSARDGVVVVGALDGPSGAAHAPLRGDSDPVTTEAALADLVTNDPRDPAFLGELRRASEGVAPVLRSPASPSEAPRVRPPPPTEPRVVPSERGRKLSFAALLAESGARLDLEEGEDIKTSQLELSEINAAELRREAQRPAEAPRPSLSPSSPDWAIELPMEVEDAAHPFDGPRSADVPVGLERTGIIPAIDWEKGEFFPPPLPAAASGQEVRPLAGSSDIPATPELVRLRAIAQASEETPLPGEDDIAAIEEVSLEPMAAEELPLIAPEEVEAVEVKRRSDPPSAAARTEDLVEGPTASLDLAPHDSDAAGMPVISPASLASLIEDSAKPSDTNSEPMPLVPATRLFDESNRPEPIRAPPRAHEEEPTNPRIEPLAVLSSDAGRALRPEPAPSPRGLPRSLRVEAPPPAIEEPTPAQDSVDRSSVLSALKSAFVETGKSEAVALAPAGQRESARAEARALVAALSQGESLSSAERVQLVLAIGRLLLKKGLITADELMDEL